MSGTQDKPVSGEKPADKPAVSAGEWNVAVEPSRKRFSGPAEGAAAVRSDFAKQAWADVVQHARESLEAEICGVLVGQVFRDDSGLWVEVAAAIRGHAASGKTHVTFTHATWEKIHAERESRFPKLAIVGWYHSHPGFGVEFSEMDAFIHNNFFAGPAQLALVVDPVAGREAVCINGVGGITYLERCWVAGRERRLELPAAATAAAGGAGAAGQPRIDALEARVSQLVGALDDMRNRIWSFYLMVGLTVALGMMMYLGFQVWMSWYRSYQPPETLNSISVPVRLGDQEVILQAQIYGWKVPDHVNAMLQDHLRMQVELEAKQEKEAMEAAKAATAAADAKAAADGGKPAGVPAASTGPAPTTPTTAPSPAKP